MGFHCWSVWMVLFSASAAAWSVEVELSDNIRSDAERARITELIKQLGDDDFEVREQAQAALKKIGVPAKQALEAVGKSGDAEVATRAVKLLEYVGVAALEEGWLKALQDKAPLPCFGQTGDTAKPTPEEIRNEETAKVRPAEPENKPGIAIDDRETCMVHFGLRWLCKVQEEDGHFDARKFGAQEQGDLEATGLVLFALLGAGHTEKVGQYKDHVRRAIAWLISRQRDDGGLARSQDGGVDGLAHCVASLALAEAAGMGRVGETMKAAQRAVDYATDKHQSSLDCGGGFGRAPGSSNPDLFTTVFGIMMLKSAKVAGLRVVPQGFDKAIVFLNKVEDKEKKGYSFLPGGEVTPRATLMGCLGRQFLGWRRDDLREYVEKAVNEFGAAKLGEENSDIMTNYFGTLCVFQQGGDTWNSWNSKQNGELLKTQHKAGPTDGSWSACGVWPGMGRVGSTVFALLCREISYRYLPLYK